MAYSRPIQFVEIPSTRPLSSCRRYRTRCKEGRGLFRLPPREPRSRIGPSRWMSSRPRALRTGPRDVQSGSQHRGSRLPVYAAGTPRLVRNTADCLDRLVTTHVRSTNNSMLSTSNDEYNGELPPVLQKRLAQPGPRRATAPGAVRVPDPRCRGGVPARCLRFTPTDPVHVQPPDSCRLWGIGRRMATAAASPCRTEASGSTGPGCKMTNLRFRDFL